KSDIGIATEGLSQFEDLVSFPCYRWHQAIVLPDGHPLPEKSPVTLQDLAQYPLITYALAFTGRGHLEPALKNADLTTHIVLSARHPDVTQKCVERGLGLALVGRMALMRNGPQPGLQVIDGGHLFDENVTRLAVRKRPCLRSYPHEFSLAYAHDMTRVHM